MAQQRQAVAEKPDDLGLSLETHRRRWMRQCKNWLEACGLEYAVAETREIVSAKKEEINKAVF